MKNKFLDAIKNQNLVEVTFRDTRGQLLQRTGAPMDFGPRRGWSSSETCYHFMVASSTELHPLSLKINKVLHIQPLPFNFEPTEIVTWEPNWHHPRNWGSCS